MTMVDNANLKLMTDKHKVHSVMSHCVRNFGEFEDFEKNCFVGAKGQAQLARLKLGLRGWIVQFINSEQNDVNSGCFSVGEELEPFSVYDDEDLPEESITSNTPAVIARVLDLQQEQERLIENSPSPDMVNLPQSEAQPDDLLPGGSLNAQDVNIVEQERLEELAGEEQQNSGVAFISPIVDNMVCHANSVSNIIDATNRRVLAPDDDKRNFRPNRKLRKRFDEAVQAIITNVLTPQAILDEVNNTEGMNSWKSKAWSGKRFENALEALMFNPDYRYTAQIKFEGAVDKGKAPRLITNTGESNQVIDCVVVGIFEKLISEYFNLHNIKHKDNTERSKLLLGMNNKGSVFVEGDGSSWDTCIGDDLKMNSENLMLNHIYKHLLKPIELDWEAWSKAKSRSPVAAGERGSSDVYGHTETHKCKFKIACKKRREKGLKPLVMTLDFTFRESGAKITSIGNYIENLVCWLAITCKHPRDVIKASKKDIQVKYICAFDDKWHTMSFIFEGDDSLLALPRHLHTDTRQYKNGKEGSKFSEEIVKAWASLGFKMKLKFVTGENGDEFVEFCGNHYLVRDGQMVEGIQMPDLDRSVKGGTTTTCKDAQINKEVRGAVRKSANYARASNYVPVYQPAAMHFAGIARNTSDCTGVIDEKTRRNMCYTNGHAHYNEAPMATGEEFEEHFDSMAAEPSYYHGREITAERLAIVTSSGTSLSLPLLSGSSGLSVDETAGTAAAHSYSTHGKKE